MEFGANERVASVSTRVRAVTFGAKHLTFLDKHTEFHLLEREREYPNIRQEFNMKINVYLHIYASLLQ